MISFFNGRKRTLGGSTSEVYAQVSVDFRDHLHVFKGARLGVFLAIALHTDEDGWAWPSYELLARETGYSEDTVSKALADLCTLTLEGCRVLLRYQPKGGGDGRFSSNRYLLFPSPEEVAEYEGAGVRHLGAQTGGAFIRHEVLPSRVFPCTENLVTNHNHDEQTPNGGGGESTPEAQTTFELLTDFGVTASVARKLAQERDADQVRAWITYAGNATGLRDPVGLVVRRLQDGEPAPDPPRERTDSHRYAQDGDIVMCPTCYTMHWHTAMCPDCGGCESCCKCEGEEEP